MRRLYTIHNSLPLGRMLGYLSFDLFIEAHSFSRAALSENCSLLGQIMSAEKYPSIFSRQMEATVYIFSPEMEVIVFIILFHNETVQFLKLENISIRLFPSFSWVIFGNVSYLDQSRANKNFDGL